jgi:hypothetical protein
MRNITAFGAQLMAGSDCGSVSAAGAGATTGAGVTA